MIELNVCIGSACHINGARNVVTTFQHLIEKYDLHNDVTLKASFCMKECSSSGVSVRLNNEVEKISAEEARSYFKEKVLPLVKKS